MDLDNTPSNPPNSHLLITGATGGLGREACEMALAYGYRVTAVGRKQIVLAELADLGCETLAMDLRELTLANSPQLAVLQNDILKTVDVIWHCSARSSPWGAYADFYADNVLVTQALAKLAGENKVAKFVHISTPSLYFDYQHHSQGMNEVKESEHQYHENTQITAKQRATKKYANHYANHYAHTKALAEFEIIKASRQFPNTHFVMLRPRAIFGRYDQVLLPRLMRVLENKSRLPLPRGGQAVMDFTYAGNVVHAMQCASLNQQLPTASVFNISNHQPMPLAELIDKVFVQQLGMDVHIKPLPYALLDKVAMGLELLAKFSKKEPMFTRYSMGSLNFDMVLDNSQAIEVLGYRPMVEMDEAIRLTTDSIKKTI